MFEFPRHQNPDTREYRMKVVRIANMEDFDRILQIWLDSEDNTLEHHQRLDIPYYQDDKDQFRKDASEYLKSKLSNDNLSEGFVLVFEVASSPVDKSDAQSNESATMIGCIIIDHYNQETKEAEFSELFKEKYVSLASDSKTRVGPSIIDAMLVYLQDLGIEIVKFEVHANNEVAIDLYNELGAVEDKIILMKKINIEKPYETALDSGWTIHETVTDNSKQIKIVNDNGNEIASVRFVQEEAGYFDTRIKKYIFVDELKLPEINMDAVLDYEVFRDYDPLLRVYYVIQMQAEKYAIESGLEDIKWVVNDGDGNRGERAVLHYLKYKDTIKQMHFDMKVEKDKNIPNYLILREEREAEYEQIRKRRKELKLRGLIRRLDEVDREIRKTNS